MDFSLKIEGLEDLQFMFDKMLPEEAKKLHRVTVHAVAVAVDKKATELAPVVSGRLRKSIVTFKHKLRDPNKPESSVYVSVNRKGRKVKNNAWYGKYVEFGTRATPPKPFMQPAMNDARTNYKEIYREMFWKKLAQKIKRDAKKRLK